MYWARGMTPTILLGELFDRVSRAGPRGLGELLDGINIHRRLTVGGHLVGDRGRIEVFGRGSSSNSQLQKPHGLQGESRPRYPLAEPNARLKRNSNKGIDQSVIRRGREVTKLSHLKSYRTGPGHIAEAEVPRSRVLQKARGPP